MKIGELEDLLGITRANIRYYEKEGLMSVERKENKYRDYGDADISQLKRIIVLRKIGVTVDDIRAYFKKEKSLDCILASSLGRLQDDLDSAESALSIATRLKAENGDHFDENYYFDLITQQQRLGKVFVDICKDMGTKTKNTLDDTLKYLFGEDYKQIWSLKSVKTAIVFLTIYMSLYVLGKYGGFGQLFKEIVQVPFGILYFTVIIGFPILFVRKSYPRLAGGYFKAVVVLEILLSLYLFWFWVACIIKNIIP